MLATPWIILKHLSGSTNSPPHFVDRETLMREPSVPWLVPRPPSVAALLLTLAPVLLSARLCRASPIIAHRAAQKAALTLL